MGRLVKFQTPGNPCLGIIALCPLNTYFFFTAIFIITVTRTLQTNKIPGPRNDTCRHSRGLASHKVHPPVSGVTRI